jgi:hypothetical protein
VLGERDNLGAGDWLCLFESREQFIRRRTTRAALGSKQLDQNRSNWTRLHGMVSIAFRFGKLDRLLARQYGGRKPKQDKYKNDC